MSGSHTTGWKNAAGRARGGLWMVLIALLASPAAAQDDKLPPGVSLATIYTRLDKPIVAVRPFSVPIPAGPVGQTVSSVIENDLRLSDRFRVLPTPTSLAAPDSVPYDQWNSINVVYLVTGEMQPSADGWSIAMRVHDVPYGQIKEAGTFALPAASAPEFRMAVHALADQVVQWTMNEPGMAATRVTFARRNEGGGYDLMVVDSDGENLRRLAGSSSDIYSPVWSPDGSRLVYTTRQEEGGWALIERDVAAGTTRTLLRADLLMTPAYSPDGRTIAFGLWQENADLEIYLLDAAGGTRPRRLTDSGGDNVSPTFSPDGRSIAFHSTRTGRSHIYVMSADGGRAELLTPVGEGVKYAAPDWSPLGTLVSFHGQSRGGMQVMLGNAARRAGQIQQYTTSGWNEDPSIAPDGRHIVYTGEGGDGVGLFIIDVETGGTRRLAAGAGLFMADWSPPVARPVPIRIDRP